MGEFESKELPLEEKFKMIRGLVMEQQGWNEKEWLNEFRSQDTWEIAIAEIKESSGELVKPNSLNAEEIREALFNYLYVQYYVAETGDDPLELMG